MFGKINCFHCNKRISKDFDFCPYCGRSLANPIKEREDYGLLGKNAASPAQFENQFNNMFSQPMLNKMLSSAMKMLEKELNQIPKDINSKTKPEMPLPSNFELFINGQKIPLNNQPINISQNKQIIQEKPKIKVNEEFLKRAAKLPRKEAKTKITRIENKVIFELATPGLLTLQNILINKLEDSIEIKAYTDDAVYFKTLPIKLNLLKYYLKEDKLFLEFQARN